MLKKFSVYYKPYIGIIILDLLCASLTTVCELVFPLIVRHITNMATDPALEFVFSTVLKLGGLYLLLRLIDTAANYYMATVGHVMGTKIETDMRHDFFAHLNKLSFSYYSWS